MNNVPETVLLESLDYLERGESVEKIIARYPELAADLRPFLETANKLATLAPQPSMAARQQSQKVLLAHAEGLKVTPIQPTGWYRLRQILLPVASLALVLILFFTTAVSVSSSAIPGDALYPIKRLVERVRLTNLSDPATAAALREQYREERVREVLALLRTGRSAEVTFEGEVENFQADHWTIASIPVTVSAATVIEGAPQIGEIARVNGRTANGELFADSIVMLTSSPTEPEATETPVPLPTPTLADTAEPTLTNTPRSAETPATTRTPTPRPTAAPTVAVGENGNANDDGNENGETNENDASNSNDDNTNDNDDSNENNENENENDANDNDDNDNANDDNDNTNDNDDNANDDNGNENDDNENNNNRGSGSNDNENENEDNDNSDNDNDDNENGN